MRDAAHFDFDAQRASSSAYYEHMIAPPARHYYADVTSRWRTYDADDAVLCKSIFRRARRPIGARYCWRRGVTGP